MPDTWSELENLERSCTVTKYHDLFVYRWTVEGVTFESIGCLDDEPDDVLEGICWYIDNHSTGFQEVREALNEVRKCTRQ